MAFKVSIKKWAHSINRDVLAVYFAARDPSTPLFIRILALITAGYALSPIDLIPDFIPIIGYLDDLILVPLGLLLVIRLLPDPILAAARQKANDVIERPSSRTAAIVILCIWSVILVVISIWMIQLMSR